MENIEKLSRSEIYGGKYAQPIKECVKKYFEADSRHRPDILEFDISNPRQEDMSALRSGDFEMSNFRITAIKGEVQSFRFYVGKTELRISGKPAEEIIAAADNQE